MNSDLTPRSNFGHVLVFVRRNIAKILALNTIWLMSVGVYAWNLPAMYEAEVLLASSSSESNQLQALTGQYGSLANLAGVSLPGTRDSSVVKAVAILKSRNFIMQFINDRGLIPILSYAVGWDPETKNIIYSTLLDGVDGEGKGLNKVDSSVSLTDEDLFEKFRENLNVSMDQDTGFVVIKLRHLSPRMAKNWLEWLVQDVNDAIRMRDVNEASRAADYLRQKAGENTVTEIDQVFYSLLQSQIQTRMLAEAREEYVFDILDPPFLPEEPASPRRFLMLAFSFLLGVFVTVAIAFGRVYVEVEH